MKVSLSFALILCTDLAAPCAQIPTDSWLALSRSATGVCKIDAHDPVAGTSVSFDSPVAGARCMVATPDGKGVVLATSDTVTTTLHYAEFQAGAFGPPAPLVSLNGDVRQLAYVDDASLAVVTAKSAYLLDTTQGVWSEIADIAANFDEEFVGVTACGGGLRLLHRVGVNADATSSKLSTYGLDGGLIGTPLVLAIPRPTCLCEFAGETWIGTGTVDGQVWSTTASGVVTSRGAADAPVRRVFPDLGGIVVGTANQCALLPVGSLPVAPPLVLAGELLDVGKT